MGFKALTVNTAAEAAGHIYAEDDAAIFQSMFGGDGVLNIGNCLKSTVISNNKVRISDGVLSVGGHIGRLSHADYQDMTIENGATGYNRNDIIYARFLTSGNVDSFILAVKKGTATTGTASDPALVQGNLYEGAVERDYPLYRVKLSGLSIASVDQLFTVIPTIPDLKAQMAKDKAEINQSLDGCLKSVSDGKKTVASAITAQGVSTAADAEFATMAANIGSVGTNKYSAGRRQGRSDVTSSPNSYGLYTKSQYDSNYSTGQANGSNSAKSNGSKSAIWLIRNNSPASLLCYDGNYFTASGNTVYCKESGSYLIANEGYSLSGNININGSSSWYGDCNVYHGGTTRSLPAGGYITPNISANSSSGSAGIIIVRKA